MSKLTCKTFAAKANILQVMSYTEDGMGLAQRLRAVAHELERVNQCIDALTMRMPRTILMMTMMRTTMRTMMMMMRMAMTMLIRIPGSTRKGELFIPGLPSLITLLKRWWTSTASWEPSCR